MGRVAHSDDWFILRTAGRSTLKLADTLNEDGYECWTPARTQIIRIPSRNVRREVKLPLLPSFVFARSVHLPELLRLARMPVKPRRHVPDEDRTQPAHRDFSVFHYLDQIPMIIDRHLDPLRLKEAEAVPRSLAPQFATGDQVRVKSGAFQGLHGRVEQYKSGYAVVLFTDWRRPAKIPAWLLSEDRAVSVHVAQRAA